MLSISSIRIIIIMISIYLSLSLSIYIYIYIYEYVYIHMFAPRARARVLLVVAPRPRLGRRGCRRARRDLLFAEGCTGAPSGQFSKVQSGGRRACPESAKGDGTTGDGTVFKSEIPSCLLLTRSVLFTDTDMCVCVRVCLRAAPGNAAPRRIRVASASHPRRVRVASASRRVRVSRGRNS